MKKHYKKLKGSIVILLVLTFMVGLVSMQVSAETIADEYIYQAPETIVAENLSSSNNPVFSLDIFNNGPVIFGATPSRPNASLAQGGTVRMWTQLNGVNTQIPYAELSVSAVFSDNSCAMEFIRVNRPWQNQSNVNLIDAVNKSSWERIYLTLSAFEQSVEVVLVSRGDGVIVVPNFLHDSFKNYIDVYVSDGMLPWNASVDALTTSPGPASVEAGFVITTPGWYTIFHRGGANADHAEFYQVKTYFYVGEDLFVDGEITFKNVPIENNRRATPVVNRVGASSNFTCEQRHPHESVGRASNLVLRLEPIGNRFNTDGVMSIAAAEFDAQGNRIPGQRWALGSDVIPWSGPGHFQTPMLRNQIFCDDTGVLIGLVDHTRALYQWTTQEESEEFMAELAASATHAYTFNAGWATNPFLDTDLPIDFFQLYFMVFTSTDLSAVTCWIEAGELLQANGRPTFFATANAHGNEQSGPESLYALMHSLAATPWGAQVVQDVNLVIYPSINRQGHFQHRRHIEGVGEARTAPGRPEQATQDGNRDFNVQHTQELEIVTSVFNAFRPHLAIDHHERGRIGGYSATIDGLGNRWTSITGVNNVGGSDTAADDIQWAPSNSPAGHPLQVTLLAEVNERFFTDTLDAGIRVWYYDNLVAGPTQGNYWMGLTGAISMISEINGQANGNEIRRVFSSYAGMRSIIEWMVEEADRVHDGINQVRQDWIEAGKIYNPTDLFALEHTNDIRHPQAAASAIPEDSNLPGWTAGTGTVPGLGIRTGTVPLTRDHRFHTAPRFRISLDNQYTYAWSQTIRNHDVIRARSFPTAYVVPLEINWNTHGIGNAPVRSYADAIARLRQMLTDNAVEYYILEAGAVMPLQQYYAQNPQISPMTRNFRAGLRAHEIVTFDVPVLFVPMDQWTRPVIAHIMEPDMGKTVSGTANAGHATSWVNMMIHTAINPVFADGSRTLLHNPLTNDFPIFRLTENNPRDFKQATTTVFSLDIFNNGPDGSPSRPNASLANAGTIRMWTQLDGVNAQVPRAIPSETITAVCRDTGECMLHLVLLRPITGDTMGTIDVNKNAGWEFIDLTVTVLGQTLEVTLHNNTFVPQATLTYTLYAEDWRESINIRFFFDGNPVEIPLADMELIVDGVVIENIRNYTLNIAGWQTANHAVFICKLRHNWENLTFTATAHNQTLFFEFTNNMFVPPTY